MIIVDIYLPAMEQTYDFSLDEDTKISVLQEEIGEILAQKTGNAICREKGWLLFNAATEQQISANTTLRRCGIRNGSRLLMV